ncbi:hypothetical protein GCM10023262_13950 [Bartonella pachyuromydis]|uniref:Uncharacterized protein n=1 Tax=Bartonella pachyuromydis TaxID=931097 RepID=A0ABP8VMC7_9HYPH
MKIFAESRTIYYQKMEISKENKKENKDTIVPVAILIYPFTRCFFKMIRANDIKMVIKANHANILKECMVTSSNPVLMLPPEDRNFGKAAI